MWKRFIGLFTRSAFPCESSELPRLILTEPSVAALRFCMEPEIRKGREGIVYLLGQSCEMTTLVVSVIRPHARRTCRSFEVGSTAMARVVRKSANLGIHLVGQAHTHPKDAYHSKGDEKGARIAYTGYVSIVFPDYGRRLPALDGMAAYMFEPDENFTRIDTERIIVIQGETS